MSIAHLCAQCGWDLGRVRAAREPHYGLWLVRCPRCHAACVRQTHPLWRHWRTFLRFKASLATFCGHAVVLLILTVINLLALSFSYRLRGWSASDAIEEYRAEIILSFVVVPILTGMWLTAGLRHCPRWKAWIGWTLFIGGLASLEIALDGVGRWFDVAHYISINPNLAREWSWHLITLTIMMTIALAGLPVGWKLLNAFAGHRRHYWRRRRRRRRNSRSYA